MDGMEEDASTTRDGNRQDPHTLVSRQIDAQNLTSMSVNNAHANTSTNTNTTTTSSDRAVRLMQHRFEFSISPPTIARSATDPFAFDAANIFSGSELHSHSHTLSHSQPMSQGFANVPVNHVSDTNTYSGGTTISSNASWNNTTLTSNLSNLTSSIITATTSFEASSTISGGSSIGSSYGSAGNSPTRYNNPNPIVGVRPGHRSAFSSRLPNVSGGPTASGLGTGGQIPAFTSSVPQEHEEQQASDYSVPPWQRGYGHSHSYDPNENAMQGQNLPSGSGGVSPGRGSTGSSSLLNRMPPSYSPWERQQHQHREQEQQQAVQGRTSSSSSFMQNLPPGSGSGSLFSQDIAEAGSSSRDIAAATEAARRSVPTYNQNTSSWPSVTGSGSGIHPAPTSSAATTARSTPVWQTVTLGNVRGRGRGGGRGRSGSFSRRHQQQHQHFFTPLPGLDTTEEDAKVSSFYSNPISPQDVVSVSVSQLSQQQHHYQQQYPYSQQQQQQMTSRISLPLGLNSPRMAIDSTPSRYFVQATTHTSTASATTTSATVARPSSTGTIDTMGSIDESVTSGVFSSSRRPSSSSGGSVSKTALYFRNNDRSVNVHAFYFILLHHDLQFHHLTIFSKLNYSSENSKHRPGGKLPFHLLRRPGPSLHFQEKTMTSWKELNFAV